MPSKEVIKHIGAGRIVAIMRGDFRGRETEIVQVLHEAGIRAVEVTLNSPEAVASIKRLAKEFAANIVVGAGTVLTVEEVERVADAGAAFIVSPNCVSSVIEATKRRDLVSMPGCFTPSEIIEAFDAGADAAKVFPAESLGVGFIRAMLSGPLPDALLVPTGGLTVENVGAYFEAGAWAAGIGSELVNPNVIRNSGLDSLYAQAMRFLAAVGMSNSGEE